MVFVALQFFASCGPGVVCQSFEPADDAGQHTLSGNASSSFRAGGFTSTA
jgi:hypothetical protein